MFLIGYSIGNPHFFYYTICMDPATKFQFETMEGKYETAFTFHID